MPRTISDPSKIDVAEPRFIISTSSSAEPDHSGSPKTCVTLQIQESWGLTTFGIFGLTTRSQDPYPSYHVTNFESLICMLNKHGTPNQDPATINSKHHKLAQTENLHSKDTCIA
uniref:Uncharacterized protein n=1 Tax=Lotharella globosa TaxID=91324 RepID=A0A7S4DVZ9_9EUKA